MNASRACPGCGRDLAVDARFCIACGAPAGGGDEGGAPRPAPANRGRARALWTALWLAAGLAVTALVSYRVAVEVMRRQSAPFDATAERLERLLPAVVTLYGFDDEDEVVQQGSGFLIRPDGLGVTNVHVLRGAVRCEARLGNGRLFDVAEVLAHDESLDLAVFRIGRRIRGAVEWPEDLATLELARGEPARVGSRVTTITSPKGLANSLSDGLVSAIREDEGIRYLQISAPISPGSSGGPVFDARGRVIGVTVFQVSEGQNLNFAVPVDSLERLLEAQDPRSFEAFVAALGPDEDESAGEEGGGGDAALELDAVLRGWVRWRAGDVRGALVEFLMAQRLSPGSPTPYFFAGEAYFELGDSLAAAGQYVEYLRRAPAGDPRRARVEQWLRERGLPTQLAE